MFVMRRFVNFFERCSNFLNENFLLEIEPFLVKRTAVPFS